MHCFTITEAVTPGILVHREGGAGIEVPESCPLNIVLGKELMEFIDALPEGNARLRQADFKFNATAMVLTPMVGRPSLKEPALVRLQTHGGVGGKVYLTANTYDEEMGSRQGRVVRRYRAFPPAGVQPFIDQPYLDKAYLQGVEGVDLFLLMHPGASFRLFRTGRLEGASSNIFIHWNGQNMRFSGTRRHDERATGLAVEA